MHSPLPSTGQEWEVKLRLHYSQLFSRIVLPMILSIAALLLLSHWHLGKDQATPALLALVGTLLMNVWLVWGKPSAGFVSISRIDGYTTLRWCINFLLVAYVAWALQVRDALTAVWVLLTFGAMIEIQKWPHKWILGGMALFSFCVLLTRLYSHSLSLLLYLLACYIGLVFIFLKLERYLQDEMVQLFETQLRCAHMEKEAQGLQRDAAIGYSVRSLSHELHNLIGVASVTVENLRDSSQMAMSKDIDRLDAVLGYMSKASSLVLDGIGNRKAPKRVISLAELRDDVQLLLGDGGHYPQIRLQIDFPEYVEQYSFEERSGSTYLIIHNLVKNAMEAVAAKFGSERGGEVKVVVGVSGSQIVISVMDNGNGFDLEHADDTFNGGLATFKAGGHGLGLLFVQEECRRNDFLFDKSSQTVNKLGESMRIIINNN